jgi:uncharacterized protein (DUF488 family)
MDQNNKPIQLYTIGFAKKKAKDFFSLLKTNNVKTLIDVRLNNASQLAGFTKKDDLEYFLKKIGNINYVHRVDFAPNKEILDSYKRKEITWKQYKINYTSLLRERKIGNLIQDDELDMACLLCSEPTAEYCHRRLLAEYLQDVKGNIIIKHL